MEVAHLFMGSLNPDTNREAVRCSFKNVTTTETVDLEEHKVELLINSLRSRTFKNV
jgi:hypothetical protein